jgi:hypothetical protein
MAAQQVSARLHPDGGAASWAREFLHLATIWLRANFAHKKTPLTI